MINGLMKFGWSMSIPYHELEDLFDNYDDTEIEVYMGYRLIKFIREIEKIEVSHFYPNKEDDHKNPDLIFQFKNSTKGVQVVQFVPSDFKMRYEYTKSFVLKTAEIISSVINPPKKINIQFLIPMGESINVPKLTGARAKKLAGEIIRIIRSENRFLDIYDYSKRFDLPHKGFNWLDRTFLIHSLPYGAHSNYYGTNNIFIDFGYDIVSMSENDLDAEVERIYTRKNNGESEILLIWVDCRTIVGNEKLISQKLTVKFQSSSFENIYFLSIPIKKNYKSNWWISKIK